MSDIEYFSAEGMVTKPAIAHFVRVEDYERLRGELSLAEEGLANAMQEIERQRTALTRIWNEAPEGWRASAIAGEALGEQVSEPQPDKQT